MKNVLLQKAMKLNRNSKNRKRWQSIVRSMAMVVVFCTTYALILPAITMEGKPECGIEEHTHEAGCYTQQPVMALTCVPEAGAVIVHSHDSRCYDGNGILICTLSEKIAHTHDENCITRAKEPSCAFVHVHTESCTGTRDVLTCEKPESQGHSHSDACTTVQQTLTCAQEHTHEAGCYTEEWVPCEEAEAEGHAHGPQCYVQEQLTCDLTTNDGHVHETACYPEKQMHCQKEQLILHTHAEGCYDAQGNLTCTQPVVIAHQHDDSCLTATEQVQEVLTCQLEEHTHDEACYPAEEPAGSEYLCGLGVHAHVETCYDEAGELTCTIPEHAHEAACLVEGLDLTADLETREQWEAAFAGLTLTGDWGQDVAAIAATQLGYSESVKNVILEGQTLRGYTRYGAKYGVPYAQWKSLFIRFCLDYAGVEDYIWHNDMNQWLQNLEAAGEWNLPAVHVPQLGQLIFLGTDDRANGGALTVNDLGIVTGLIPAAGGEGEKVKTIQGDVNGAVAEVILPLTDAAILGYSPLPESKVVCALTEHTHSTACLDTEANLICGLVEHKHTDECTNAAVIARNHADVVTAQIQALPQAQTAKETLLERNKVLDRAGYDAYLNEIQTAVTKVKTAYEALSDTQKRMVSNTEHLTRLEAVCSEALWQQLPALTQDDALVTVLRAEGAVENKYSLEFAFAVDMTARSAARYGEGRIKLEFVLPASEEQAAFDLQAMSWLEEANVTAENRVLNEEEIPCQILTGYKRLKASAMDEAVIPGSFAEKAVVKVLDLPHGTPVQLQLRAAMEHNAWGETCAAHEAEETLTILTDTVKVSAPASTREQRENYEAFLAEYNDLIQRELTEEEKVTEGEALWAKLSEAYYAGKLAWEDFEEIGQQVIYLAYARDETAAEWADGIQWMLQRDEYARGVTAASASPFTVQSNVATMQAFGTMEMDREPVLTDEPSDSQVVKVGGKNNSADGAVYVSKTIDGTDEENVFDITLEIVTHDVVTEVYEEPDMAVVLVMDISNTMNADFSGSTRYASALAATKEFMKLFAQNNKGASHIGVAAFNTDAHQILPMQDLSGETEDEAINNAETLYNNMEAKTDAIIKASGYGSSHKRFTNIEGGLKLAYDMLNSVSNENKYIVFLSDGFPTTYLSSGYIGYDPYDESGTRFRDSVRGVPCKYGTSYSDEAAIRARKMATTLKNQGATIFSVGVDIGGQSIAMYETTSSDFSVIDRRSTTYELGSATSTNAFKTWLRDKIGSGDRDDKYQYYYDSTNPAGLMNAFTSIFQTIKEQNAASSHLDWVATDPLPNMGVHEVETLEFIGFFDKEGKLVDTDLTAVNLEGVLYGNTATYDESTHTITWDTKNSAYFGSSVEEGKNDYLMSLTYRVRLRNEDAEFAEQTTEGVGYPTNDTTSLTYRVIEKNGENLVISPKRTITFPIPEVKGYLGELTFRKTDSRGEPLADAEFTLSHDPDSCGACRGDMVNSVTLADMVQTSDAYGNVTFSHIPSGHVYTLKETKVPTGYAGTTNTYQVTIDYDTLTVTVKDQDGNTIPWDNTIVNFTSYQLPQTGGMGTTTYLIGVTMLLAAAAWILLNNRKPCGKEARKQR